ncbi:hypothetical protein IIA15_09340 [candidate division TA06 bacterium]|nr:hypothetical protein [candidate division TA06 bacterium]
MSNENRNHENRKTVAVGHLRSKAPAFTKHVTVGEGRSATERSSSSS